ncbi:MAG: ATP-grasp domain-containing protein [Campylobacterales bacterium]|nr:ATP-grasp domain-containing protein [Campylobacterales bacterium]
MPKIVDLQIEDVIKYSKEHHIKYIIPTRDEDVVYFARYKQLLLEHNIFVFVSNYTSVLLCFDKLKFYEDTDNDFIIPTYTNVNDLDKKDFFVLKDRFGAGSSKIQLNITFESVLHNIKKFKNPIIQPFIQGQEYSIDSYVNKNGICIASIIRSRDLIINGESKITTRIFDKQLILLCKKFLEQNKILGHSVLQVIKTDKQYYFVECNARFGGASTLSVKLGLESFYWFLLESNDQEIRPKISDKILKQIRIQEDIYIES